MISYVRSSVFHRERGQLPMISGYTDSIGTLIQIYGSRQNTRINL